MSNRKKHLVGIGKGSRVTFYPQNINLKQKIMWDNLLYIIGFHNWKFLRYQDNVKIFRCINCRDYKIKIKE